MKKIIILISSLTFLASCGGEQTENEEIANGVPHAGKALMELNCNSCHSPSAGENARIAPPLIAVKKHYLENGMSKEDFIKAIQKWIENPSEDISKMPGAIRKFGIMAKVDYPKETIEQIADYLFTNEVEKPAWFDEHYKTQHGKKTQSVEDNEVLSLAEIGMKYAISTKSILGKNLMGAIQAKGVEHAVTFCNVQAMPITDSMSTVNNARIKRVSDKPRNPNNRANAKELTYISKFKVLMANNEKINPIVVEEAGKVNFYFPIETNAMCLQCHGAVEQELKFSTYEKIKALYPTDEAIGYNIDQVRGMWSIEFDN
jgi:hypothetical protein